MICNRKRNRKSWNELSKKEKQEKVWDICFASVIIGMALFINPILQSTLNTQHPLAYVISESMLPTIHKGDILIIKGVHPSQIQAGNHENQTGDIILFDSNNVWPDPRPEPIVHRVVEKYYDNTQGMYFFVTHGDANYYSDPPSNPGLEVHVPEDKVYGVVVGIYSPYFVVFITISGLVSITFLNSAVQYLFFLLLDSLTKNRNDLQEGMEENGSSLEHSIQNQINND